MAVRVLLTSGAERLVDADAARLDRPFFLICQSGHTMLTLLAQHVVGAQVENDRGEVTDYVFGTGLPPEKP